MARHLLPAHPPTLSPTALAALFLIAALSATAGCQPTDDTDDIDDAVEQHDVDSADVDPGDAEQPLDAAEPVPAAPPDFAETVAKVRPAVVNIYTRTDPPDGPAAPFSPPGMVPDDRVQESLGSGFIFDADDGLVLTNHHVIDGASEIAVRLLDERVFSAELVGTDPPTDIAVLRIEELDEEDEPVPAVELGNSDDLDVGNWVLAIGNPLGLASTVTAGIASATGRQVMPPGGQLQFQDFIQTDASINPGSSGGPLVDIDGRVVGIATAMSTDGHGLGFAIPMNMVDEVRGDLVEYGRVERSWLGIYIGAVPEQIRERFDLPDQGGAMITRLVDDGPADNADLEPGDVLVRIGGEDIDDPNHLAWLAATLGVDETVDTIIYRGSERMTVDVTLGALPTR